VAEATASTVGPQGRGEPWHLQHPAEYADRHRRMCRAAGV